MYSFSWWAKWKDNKHTRTQFSFPVRMIFSYAFTNPKSAQRLVQMEPVCFFMSTKSTIDTSQRVLIGLSGLSRCRHRALCPKAMSISTSPSIMYLCNFYNPLKMIDPMWFFYLLLVICIKKHSQIPSLSLVIIKFIHSQIEFMAFDNKFHFSFFFYNVVVVGSDGIVLVEAYFMR